SLSFTHCYFPTTTSFNGPSLTEHDRQIHLLDGTQLGNSGKILTDSLKMTTGGLSPVVIRRGRRGRT
ncbi:MAG: hypothetical protein KDE19_10460, partial [Caldilineaceae bacterium]|nr:hypothetical protein [Caldilineaceae bacterium]